MLKLGIMAPLFLILAGYTTLALNTEKEKAVVIPSEIYFPTIVAQPDCPLKIEKAVMAKMMDGTRRTFYQARNTGDKAISYFQIDAVQSDGTGFTAIWPYRRSLKDLLPSQIAVSNINDGSVEFLPLTEDLKIRLDLTTRKMRAIVFFIVVKIEFQDGTTFHAEPLRDSLEEHLKMFEDEYENVQPKRNAMSFIFPATNMKALIPTPGAWR